MSDHEAIASHHIGYDGDSKIIDQHTGEPFPAADYSRMKYGDRAATQGFGEELAHHLVQEIPALVDSDTPPEFLVAYKVVPPACYYLSRYCLDVVNGYREHQGKDPGTVQRVHKNRVTATNYAVADASERAAELASIGFSLNGHPLDGAPVAILDDIRITGAAEKKILEVLETERPSVIGLGYVAIFDRVQAALHPSVEMELNSAFMTQIEQLLPAIQTDNFDLNIRTLKWLLASKEDDLVNVLRQLPEDTLGQIYKGTVDTGPEFMASYKNGSDILQTVLAERGLS